MSRYRVSHFSLRGLPSARRCPVPAVLEASISRSSPSGWATLKVTRCFVIAPCAEEVPEGLRDLRDQGLDLQDHPAPKKYSKDSVIYVFKG